ncbi:MAG: DUF11 domain-containing protein, partial [Thermoanaerobaculia bacterium]|nr:DUF11 domain-containing protein [Thermoanaerobaculia bacterium]
SYDAVLSGDGAWVTFTSTATDLVAGHIDTNLDNDVFQWSLVSNAISLVSHAADSPTTSANGGSSFPTASTDGDIVAFRSEASNLVTGQLDQPDTSDIFTWSRSSGIHTLISHSALNSTATGNSPSYDPQISSDGSTVAFESAASDLVADFLAPSGSFRNLFVWHQPTDTTQLANHMAGSNTTASNDRVEYFVLSRHGDRLAFESEATNHVVGSDDNQGRDVFLWHRISGNIELVSHSLVDPTATGDSGASAPVISGNGDSVAFSSNASDLVVGLDDRNGNYWDTFIWERSTGIIELGSSPEGAGGLTSANSGSTPSHLSDSGDVLLLLTGATDFLAGAVGGPFSLRRETGNHHVLRSPADPQLPTMGNSPSENPQVSADGRFVVFYTTDPTVLAPPNQGIVLWDRLTGQRTLVNHRFDDPNVPAGGSHQPIISADGNSVVFSGSGPSSFLVEGLIDLNPSDSDVFLWNRLTDETTLVSHRFDDALTTANDDSMHPRVSSDGQTVVFVSQSTDLVAGLVKASGEFASDLYSWDRSSGAVRLINHLPGDPVTTSNLGVDFQNFAVLSDGGAVAFHSAASDLAAGTSDTNESQDVFHWNPIDGAITLVSRSASNPLATANGPSSYPDISADGQGIVYYSFATDLVSAADTNEAADAFYWTLSGATNQLMSQRPAGLPSTGNDASAWPRISADGSTAVFQSWASDLVSQDDNADSDVFLWDTSNGSITLVSHVPGSASQTANGNSYLPMVSADGERIAYKSLARNLVPGFVDTNGNDVDIFLWDRSSGSNFLASHTASSATTTGDGYVVYFELSLDGDSIAFQSEGTDYVEGFDSNGTDNIFLFSASPIDADLTPVVEASSALLAPSDPLTYTIGIENLSPQPAANVHLTIVLPPGSTLVSVSSGEWSCHENSLRLYCSRATVLGSSTSSPIVVELLVPGGEDTISCRALAFWYGPDSDLSNNETELVSPVGTEDWGDAPDPLYPTLALSNGPRHTLGSGLFFGSLV